MPDRDGSTTIVVGMAIFISIDSLYCECSGTVDIEREAVAQHMTFMSKRNGWTIASIQSFCRSEELCEDYRGVQAAPKETFAGIGQITSFHSGINKCRLHVEVCRAPYSDNYDYIKR
jgi:hypothetical protein